MSRLKRTIRQLVLPNVMQAWWRRYGTRVPSQSIEPRDWIHANPAQGRHIPLAVARRSSLPPRRIAGAIQTIDQYAHTLFTDSQRAELNSLLRGDVSYEYRDEVNMIARGSCVDPAGLTTSPDGYRLGDGSNYGFTNLRSDRLDITRIGYMPRPTHHDGRVAVLAGGKGYFAYYHWLMETWRRLGRLELAGLTADKYYAAFARKYQKESLATLGIGVDQVIPASSFRHVQADELVIPSTLFGHASPIECDFLYERLAQQLSNDEKKGHGF